MLFVLPDRLNGFERHIDQIPNSDTQCAFYDHRYLRSPSCKRFGALYRPSISIPVGSESCEKILKKRASAVFVHHPPVTQQFSSPKTNHGLKTSCGRRG